MSSKNLNSNFFTAGLVINMGIFEPCCLCFIYSNSRCGQRQLQLELIACVMRCPEFLHAALHCQICKKINLFLFPSSSAQTNWHSCTQSGCVQPVFWTGSFPKSSFLDRQIFLSKSLNNGSVIAVLDRNFLNTG